jgi:hypothetical protein
MNFFPLSKELKLPWFSGFWISSLIYKPELKELTTYIKLCGPKEDDENFDFSKKYKREIKINDKIYNIYVYYATGFISYKFIKINEHKTQFISYE